MEQRVKIMLNNYVYGTISVKDEKVLVEYLVSNPEYCYELLVMMRNKAMKELGIVDDYIVEDVINANNKSAYFIQDFGTNSINISFMRNRPNQDTATQMFEYFNKLLAENR